MLTHQNRSKAALWGYISVDVAWSIIIGLLLPRTPAWGTAISALVAMALTSLILHQLLRLTQSARPMRDKDTPSSAWIPGVLGAAAFIRVIVRMLSSQVSEAFYEFLILSALCGFFWYAITLTTCIEFFRFSKNPSYSLLLGIVFSAVGIATGYFIHAVLSGSTLLPLCISFLYSFLVSK